MNSSSTPVADIRCVESVRYVGELTRQCEEYRATYSLLPLMNKHASQHKPRTNTQRKHKTQSQNPSEGLQRPSLFTHYKQAVTRKATCTA